MKNIISFFLFSLCLQQGFTQKEKLEQWPWQLKNILYLSDSTGVGSLEYSDKKSGLAFLNQNGQVEKQVAIPGNVLGIGKWKGNVLAIYTNAWEYELVKDIHAVLVDAEKATIINHKLIYQNPERFQLDCALGNDDEGNFNYLRIRTTASTVSFSDAFSSKKKGSTTALTALFLSDNMEPRQQQLASAAIGGIFLTSCTNRKGDIVILSELSGNVIAEKFGPDGQLQKKLTSPLNFPENRSSAYSSRSLGRFNPASDNILAFSIQNEERKSSHYIFSLFVFDFDKGTVLANGPTPADKNYLKELKEDPELARTKAFNEIEKLQPDGLVYIGDKLAVCNEIRYMEIAGRPGPSNLISEGGIVAIYDSQLHLLHRFFLNKSYITFIDIGRGLSYHVRDGKLLILGNELTGSAAHGNFCYVINLDNYTMEKKKPEWGNVSKWDPVNPQTVFWFKRNILKNHSAEDNTLGKHVSSFLVKASYE